MPDVPVYAANHIGRNALVVRRDMFKRDALTLNEDDWRFMNDSATKVLFDSVNVHSLDDACTMLRTVVETMASAQRMTMEAAFHRMLLAELPCSCCEHDKMMKA